MVAYAQLFLAFAARSGRRTFFQVGPFTNLHLLGAIAISGLLQLSAVTLPFTHRVFETSSHPALEWVLVFGLALVPVTLVEVAKLVRGALARGHA